MSIGPGAAVPAASVAGGSADLEAPVIIAGAGIGGLAAAVDLAARGVPVVVVEKEAAVGGKMRRLSPAGRPIDAGPTVFTMRDVFDGLLAHAGTSTEAELGLLKLEILARHAWDGDDARLDLFADNARSADAIGDFAGAQEAAGFRAFTAEAARIFATLDRAFMQAPRPSPVGLAMNVGLLNLPALLATRPFSTLWSALGGHFRDPRLRQLFGRYATYCGSNPFAAPATLMLIAHAELMGVWAVEGGMHALAQMLAGVAARKGADVRCGAGVAEILTGGGRATGVRLTTGEELPAAAIVWNGDVSALGAGMLGAQAAKAARATPPARRSLSAVTWCIDAPTEGFPLTRHNVFFSRDYPAEFRDIADARRPPAAPTVYVCAQDRGDDAVNDGPDRLLCLVNAPADGDSAPLSADMLRRTAEASFGLMEQCGFRIDRSGGDGIMTAPEGFDRLFPASGGALYGPATHGAFASFQRAGARSRIPGLYLAGGTVHPSAGVPMAAISGRLAAAAVMEDRR
jgi:1-hydroxycarotenoid 3,4-desaturase